MSAETSVEWHAAEEDSRVVAHEVALAARIHDRVVPPLCAVARVLGGEGDLGGALRARCHDEVTAAMLELRAMLLNRARDGDDGAPVRVARLDGASVAPALEALVCTVAREALRNALRHGSPSEVRVEITADGGVLGMSVVNDGASGTSGTTGLGIGLRLAAAAAAEHDGDLTWGQEEEGRWQVRLTAPLTSI